MYLETSFYSFGLFFWKCSFLWFQNFISPSAKYSINLIFSVVVCICSIHVFNGVIPCQIMQDFYIMSSLSHGFFEIFPSGRYHSDMKILKILASNASIWEFMEFFKNSKLVCLEWHFRYYVFVDNFCSKQTLVSKFDQGIFFDSKNLKMTLKLLYCLQL